MCRSAQQQEHADRCLRREVWGEGRRGGVRVWGSTLLCPITFMYPVWLLTLRRCLPYFGGTSGGSDLLPLGGRGNSRSRWGRSVGRSVGRQWPSVGVPGHQQESVGRQWLSVCVPGDQQAGIVAVIVAVGVPNYGVNQAVPRRSPNICVAYRDLIVGNVGRVM